MTDPDFEQAIEMLSAVVAAGLGEKDPKYEFLQDHVQAIREVALSGDIGYAIHLAFNLGRFDQQANQKDGPDKMRETLRLSAIQSRKVFRHEFVLQCFDSLSVEVKAKKKEAWYQEIVKQWYQWQGDSESRKELGSLSARTVRGILSESGVNGRR